MAEDVLASVASLVEAIDRLVHSQPDLLIEGLAWFLVLSLTGLLFALRSARRSREQVLQLRARLVEAERQIAGRAAGATAPSIADVIRPPEAQLPVTSTTAVPGEVPSSVKVEEEVISAPTEVSALPSVAEETPISRGLKKSRSGFLARLTNLFSGRSAIDTSTLDELEEVLILSDVGARCASDLVEEVRTVAASVQQGLTPEDLTGLLKGGIRKRLVSTPGEHQMYHPTKSPLIVLVVGVNGVGKTTTVAKLATKYIQQGKKVVAVAADTFRAAAVDQLAEWSSRVGFTLVRGSENAKPSAVVFDGMVAAKDGGFDVVLIDTAGRLHTKSNLMQELEGVRNSIRRHFPDGPHETVLVLDGVSGQNALSQAREFNQAVPLTGIVVTKLDGTPKGGIIVAISQELNLPVYFIGVGERVDDLLPFNAEAFVDALFEEDVRSSARHQEFMPHVSNQ